ncbi:TRAP transporter fused permease subunit [Haloterrigena sp. SYSU A121-1]|uniref:TRAP transporter fused permease subunit n=1 Tax=Haloterrigena gelatinilytica TaxID=2741724 RepID=A0A8J8GU05_9EURY|nr:TRAP transporter fused permease subunit [Haloterrigena gelatinilytica]NUB93440.1 TRAP transporter fused permease subunit [Haloterrigena gelatinilytica]
MTQTDTSLDDLEIEDPSHGISGQSDPDNRYLRYVVIALSVAFASIFLYTAGFGIFDLYIQRSLFLLFTLVLIFLLYPVTDTVYGYFVDGGLIALAIVSNGYIIMNAEAVARRHGIPEGPEIILGTILVLLIFEASRRCIGWVLTVLCLVFIGYARFGSYLTGYWGHRGYTFEEIVAYLYMTSEGIWSFPVGIASTYIITFVIFGAFLLKSGIADLFTNLAMRIAGRVTGGPALIAVITSSLFGTVSGAAPANVATTGSVTIPMMKSIGFRNDFAGAVESSASAGGLLMPPIMGAAAFLMVEFTGIPYREIILAATIPAFLYYLGIGSSVYFVAKRRGIGSWDAQSIKERYPSPREEITTRGHMLIPFLLLIYLIFEGWAVTTAAFWSLLLAVGVSWLTKPTRMMPRDVIMSLDDGSRKTLEIAMACAAAGIIYAIVNMTGLGTKFASVMLGAAQLHIMLALAGIMIGCIILGMGLPATVAYLITAAVAAAGLEQLGFATLNAHLFIFYFAILATITPPVGLALYTAAAIASSNWLTTGIEGLKLTFVGFIIPYIFVFDGTLLAQGTLANILLVAGVATVGTVSIAAGLNASNLGSVKRFGLIAAGIGMYYPSYLTYSLGLVLFVFLSWDYIVGVVNARPSIDLFENRE